MRDKHSSKKILLGIVGMLVVLGGATTAVWDVRAPHAQPQATVVVATAPAPATGTKGAAAVRPIVYRGETGKSALELLKTHAQITTKSSSYGDFVDSINGVAGGVDGKYWTFYVNGKQAQVGAGAYITQSIDIIEWKFE